MYFLFIIAIIFLGFWWFLLPFLNRGKISDLNFEIDSLKRRIKALEAAASPQKIKEPEHQPAETPPPSYWDMPPAPLAEEPLRVHELVIKKQKEAAAEAYHPAEKAPAQPAGPGFELQLGARLPVWIGGIALALAGFYFVKYSIDAGWLSPAVRVTLGILAGFGMLLAGNVIRNKPDFANGTRIAQALSGAGIADLYVCSFAAASLYNLVPPMAGFVGMAAVTAAAVILSLRHGAPIALLGLIGGFLTPMLIGSSHPSAPALFIYLYVVLTGLLIVIRKQGWWLLAMLAVAASFLWVVLWMLGGSFDVGDTLWLGLFLAAVSFTTVGLMHRKQPETDSAMDIFPISLPDATMGGALTLMAFVVDKGGFGYLEWSLFGLLTVGGIVMAFFDQARYGKFPPFSAFINAIMLACWEFTSPQDFALILSLFAVLYMGSGYMLQSRSKDPLRWALLSAVSGIGYYLLGYFRLHGSFATDIPHFWGLLALALSALGVGALSRIVRDMPAEHAQKQHLLATYTAIATAFLSTGLCVEIDHAFLPTAIAGEVLALAWISTRVNIQALRKITAIVACGFAVLLVPQILTLAQFALDSIADSQPYMSAPHWPLFHFGLPALCFLGASILLLRKQDGALVRIFEIAAMALIAVTGYYLTRQLMHSHEDLYAPADFAERGLLTNMLFAYALACLWLGRRYARSAVSFGGFVLSALAVLRTGYFDLLLHNPLWNREDVGAMPVINTLLLTYGAPVFWVSRITKHLRQQGKETFAKFGYASMLLLTFVLLSFEVRQIFHGAFLDQGAASNAEVYSYSIVWLLFGLGLLFFGTLRNDRMIRLASMAVMILTVAKVFLYDASALTGLLRVFSFAGLGLSLLGLSWFYTRFFFKSREEK